MIHLNNTGSAYEIGFQHGASCPEAVRMAWAAWGRVEGIEAARLEAGIRLVEGRLQRFFPEVLEEIRGIAEGSGVPYDRILAMNCLCAVVPGAGEGPACSTIGFADSDAGVLLGKTADWEVEGEEDVVAWQRYQPADGQGYGFVHYGCAGTLWSEGGLNEAGMGMVLNGLPGSGAKPDSLHWLPLCRGVLQHCRDVREALEFLGRYDVMYWGFNLVLADAGGDLAFVEVVPGAQAVGRPQGDYLVHTNHCVCPETLEHQPEEDVATTYGLAGLAENSRARYRALMRLAPEAPRTWAGMEALLRDRSVPGGEISQSNAQGLRTVCALVVAPAQGKIWGAEGFPLDVPFVEYRV